MDKASYLADLQTKVIFLGEAIPQNTSPAVGISNQALVAQIESSPAPQPGTRTFWMVDVSEIGPIGVYTHGTIQFQVLNLGCVAGPQTYRFDVLDGDGNVIHAAGSPVLDGDGNQVVYPAEWAERVLPARSIENPLGDVIDAVAYWEGLKADPASNVVAYREIPGADKRSDLGFYTMKAWVKNVDGTLSEKVYLTTRDASGNPVHTEIV